MATMRELIEEEIRKRQAGAGAPTAAAPSRPAAAPAATLRERVAQEMTARRAPPTPPPAPARAPAVAAPQRAMAVPPPAPSDIPRRAGIIENVTEPLRHVGEGGPPAQFAEPPPLGRAIAATLAGPLLGPQIAPGMIRGGLQALQEGLRVRRQEGGTAGKEAALAETIMRGFNVGAEAAERAIGTVEQAAFPGAVTTPLFGVTAPRQLAATAAASAERVGLGKTPVVKKLTEFAGPVRMEAMRQPGIGPEAFTYPAWTAAQFTYEGPQYVGEARERIKAGENPDTVVQEVAESLGGGAQVRDLVGQMVFDPLNALSLLGKGGRVKGFTKVALVDNSIAHSSDEGAEIMAGLAKVETGVLAHTPEAQAGRLADKTYNVIHDVMGSMRADATAADKLDVLRALVERGDDAGEVFERAGLAARAIEPEMARRLGVAEGTMLSVPESRSAWEATAVLQEVAGDAQKQAGLLDDYQAAVSKYQAALGTRTGPLGRVPTTVQDEADDAMAALMGRFDQGARTVLGVTKRETPGPLRAWGNLQGFFATYMHLGFSPGYAIRNFVQNTVVGFADSIDMLTPMRKVDDTMAAAGFLPRGAFREVGAGIAPELARRKTALGIRPFAFDLASRAESRAARRAVYTGIRDTFAREWALGRAIPGGAYDTLVHTVGTEKAADVLSHVLGAWTPGQLEDITRGLQAAAEPWRAISDPALIAELRRFDAVDDVAGVLRGAESADDAAQGLLAWADQGVEQANTAATQATLYRQGSYEAGVQDLAADALRRRGVSEKAIGRYVGEFPGRFQAGTVERSNLYHAIEARLRATGDNGLEFRRLADEVRDEFFGPAFDLRNELYPQAATGRVPWDGALLQVDEAFRAAHEGWMTRLTEYARTIGTDVPALPENLRYVPLSQVPQFRMAQITSAAAEAGMPTATAAGKPADQYLINFLKKEGVLPATFKGKLLTPEAIGKLPVEQFDAIMGALRGRAKPLAEAAEAAMEIAPAVADVAPVGADVAEHGIALAQERRLLAQRVIEDVTARANLPAHEWTPAEVQAVRDFMSELQPRLAGVRAVGRQVGEAMRDFAFFNYGDKRNFDTALGYIFAYPYWHTRNMAHFARRAFEQPGAIAALFRLRMKLREVNRGLPEWWKDQIKLPDALGENLYVPIMGLIDPLNGILGDKIRDPDVRTTLAAVVLNELGQWGPSLHVGISEAMAFAAHMKGDEDQARAWLSYFGGPTRAFNAATVLLRQAGWDAIPPGGLGWEPYLSDNGRFVGTKWDARRIGKALYEMARGGQVTPEQALDAAVAQEGDIYDQALQLSKERTAAASLMSWLLGPSMKPRPESEVEIAQMDTERRALYTAKEGMTPEEYRLAWADFRNKYPFADLVTMFRRNADERDEVYSWGVINRLPPANSDFLEAAGIDAGLLDKFYSGKGLDDFTDAERQDWIGGMRRMGAILAMPDTATAQEWDEARAAKRAVEERLKLQYGEEIYALQDSYFALQTQEEKTAFLERHPVLEDVWDTRDKLVTGDPLLLAYYGALSTVENVMLDDFYTEMERRYPAIGEKWDAYFRLKESDADAASQYMADHPELEVYMQARQDYWLTWRGELDRVSGMVAALEPQFSRLREDAVISGEREKDIADLVATRAALADFELPDLRGEELNAMLQQQLDRVPEGGWSMLYRDLRAAGGLDKTLRDTYSLGRFDVREEAFEGNRPEMLALISAVETVANERGWEPARAPEGTAALAPVPQPTVEQVQAQFLDPLRERAPMHYALLRRYVASGKQERETILRRAPGFRRLVARVERYMPAIRDALWGMKKKGGKWVARRIVRSGGSGKRRKTTGPAWWMLQRGMRQGRGGGQPRRTRMSSQYL